MAEKILRSRANDCVSYNSVRRSLRMTRFFARFDNIVWGAGRTLSDERGPQTSNLFNLPQGFLGEVRA
jgi:hypothetical protein